MSKPYLSIVIAVRNDNYGGDFTQRLQACIDWNTKWLETFKIETEFLLVNWNPVAENDSLTSQILWPKNRNHVQIRMINVPNSVHQNYVNTEIRNTVPLFEFIAKNAGIRRAKGQFILSMNADVLIHPTILKIISERSLIQNKYYRANRLDFRPTEKVDVNGLFNAGFAISLKGFMYYFKDGMNKRIQYQILKALNPIRLRWELFKAKYSGLANMLKLNVVYNNGAYLAHCLNSGDFMLMSSLHWAEMNAYPEYTSISTHTDAIFSVLAYQRFTEHVFSDPVFHQEHQRRYNWDAIQNDDSFVKAYNFFEEVANAVKKKESTNSFLNSADWGLIDYELSEEIIRNQ